MTREEVESLLHQAIEKLLSRDRLLLDLDVSERSISHQLARYLSELVEEKWPSLSIDCEYNRHFDRTKRLGLPRRQTSDDDVVATTVYPDIVIHQRNSDANNILALEMKKLGGDTTYDLLKLEAFGRELGYRHCVHLVLGLREDGGFVRQLQWVY